MYRWYHPARHPTFVLLPLMAIVSAAFALNSFDLARLAIANITYIRNHGVMAVFDGGLLQMGLLIIQGMFSLLCYLYFKAIEHVLMARWFPK